MNGQPKVAVSLWWIFFGVIVGRPEGSCVVAGYNPESAVFRARNELGLIPDGHEIWKVNFIDKPEMVAGNKMARRLAANEVPFLQATSTGTA